MKNEEKLSKCNECEENARHAIFQQLSTCNCIYLQFYEFRKETLNFCPVFFITNSCFYCYFGVMLPSHVENYANLSSNSNKKIVASTSIVTFFPLKVLLHLFSFYYSIFYYSFFVWLLHSMYIPSFSAAI